MSFNFDTDLDEAAKVLSERMGEEVTLDKVANLISVRRATVVHMSIAQVAEQEMFAAADPLQFLADKAIEELDLPTKGVIRVHPDNMIRAVLAPIVRNERGALGHAGAPPAMLATETGFVGLHTYSSEQSNSLRLARNCLYRQLRTLLSSPRPGAPGNTAVIVGEINAYTDPNKGHAQVWFVGAVLQGRWSWDDDSSQIVQEVQTC